MLEKRSIATDSIRVPLKRAKSLDAGKVQAIAEDIIEHGQSTLGTTAGPAAARGMPPRSPR